MELEPEKKLRSFEECIDIIDEEIKKRKHKWKLSFLTYMDYEDVSQIVKLHIFQKWSIYDQKKPLIPWLNTVINNQIKNISRNNFVNFLKPCLGCPQALENDKCRIYGEQSSSCSLLKHWEKNKKRGYFLSTAESLTDKIHELKDESVRFINLEKNVLKVHAKMKECLKPNEWKVYELLYIRGKDKVETAQLMNYKTNEKNRNPGYKNIKKIEKKIIEKIKKLFRDDEIDIY